MTYKEELQAEVDRLEILKNAESAFAKALLDNYGIYGTQFSVVDGQIYSALDVQGIRVECAKIITEYLDKIERLKAKINIL